MNFDRFVLILSLFFLPLLFLPREWLTYGCYVAVLIIVIGIFRKQELTILLGALTLVSYWQIINISSNANKYATSSQQLYQFQIQKIIKQAEFQTAFAKLENGDVIYLNWQSDEPLELEQYYQANLKIRSISSRLNIGNFDRQRWFFAHHLNGSATVKKVNKLTSPHSSSLRIQWLEYVRKQLEPFPSKGLLLALAFGERAWLANSDWQLFQQTSTAHLIAISGLHIGLAMGIGFWLAKCIQWLFLRVGILSAVSISIFFPRGIGLVFAIFYSYLSGFAIPTLRALLAIFLVLLCQWLRRYYTAWQLWWRIVALLLVLDPLTILSDSFWLSVLAVLSLIIWYAYFPLAKLFPFCKKWQKFNRLWLSLVHLQLGIFLVFSPVQFFFFEGISPWAFIANFLIIPLYSVLLVPLVIFSLLTNNILNSWAWANWLAQGSLKILSFISADWIALSQNEQYYLLALNALCLLALYLLQEKLFIKYWKQLGLFVVSSSFVISFIKFPISLEWVTFDVGQGLAQALVYQDSGKKRAILYDTGASWKDKSGRTGSMAQLEILPYLKRNGIQVEAVFLSHDDNDHSGGVEDILAEYPQARLISASTRRYAKHDPETCVAGQTWQFGQFELKAIYPISRVKRAKNEDSCIILVKIDRFSLLFTGDTTSAKESLFAHQIGQVDFLQIPHHGSKTSSSYTLLAQTKPQIAIISAGRWNPWKMPHQQVLARLSQQNIKTFSTATVGMVRVRFEKGSWKLETARNNRSPWYRETYGLPQNK
ncbi:DNA internalization-related competence protein ComEC/Rec2 [Actinobacillus equuli]|uniref:DNA internalization-related competence protein ComEC/Rec2 n=1 Tax=Actinobacillus equuli TaxID=718 RepID=UPI0024420CE7|nr:DNA internalization-related competence protein ComEC/Rec2 [Actinobacillus equuli]WGE65968.1 DNA internalization-related competence protein ComEC/Rec2 [Actinobacillus equuli subsp. equuli]WGE79899.1 DNA internalization-related competence protein ComEC/Rec2 [Actinobacillus equuli subsp. equuli]